MRKLFDISDLLACPNCKQGLRREAERFYCAGCRLYFPVEQGRPVLFAGGQARQTIAADLGKPAGREMFQEFSRNNIFYKAFNLGKSLISSEFSCNPRLREIKRSILEKKLVLEIGAGNRRLSEQIVNFDIAAFPSIDIVGDAHELPFKDGTFDAVWIEMALEHVRDPGRIASEIHRVLKPGGEVLAMTPFILSFHGYPDDYYRYTLPGLAELFKQFTVRESGVYKGPSVALVNFLSDYFTLFSFSRRRPVFLALKALFLLFLFPLKYLDLILIRNGEAHKMSNALFYWGRK